MFYEKQKWSDQIAAAADFIFKNNTYTKINLGSIANVIILIKKYCECCIKLSQKTGQDTYYIGYDYTKDSLFGGNIMKVIYMSMKGYNSEKELSDNLKNFDTKLRDQIWIVTGLIYYYGVQKQVPLSPVFAQLLYPYRIEQKEMSVSPVAPVLPTPPGQKPSMNPLIIGGIAAAGLFLFMGKKKR